MIRQKRADELDHICIDEKMPYQTFGLITYNKLLFMTYTNICQQ